MIPPIAYCVSCVGVYLCLHFSQYASIPWRIKKNPKRNKVKSSSGFDDYRQFHTLLKISIKNVKHLKYCVFTSMLLLFIYEYGIFCCCCHCCSSQIANALAWLFTWNLNERLTTVVFMCAFVCSFRSIQIYKQPRAYIRKIRYNCEEKLLIYT